MRPDATRNDITTRTHTPRPQRPILFSFPPPGTAPTDVAAIGRQSHPAREVPRKRVPRQRQPGHQNSAATFAKLHETLCSCGAPRPRRVTRTGGLSPPFTAAPEHQTSASCANSRRPARPNLRAHLSINNMGPKKPNNKRNIAPRKSKGPQRPSHHAQQSAETVRPEARCTARHRGHARAPSATPIAARAIERLPALPSHRRAVTPTSKSSPEPTSSTSQ